MDRSGRCSSTVGVAERTTESTEVRNKRTWTSSDYLESNGFDLTRLISDRQKKYSKVNINELITFEILYHLDGECYLTFKQIASVMHRNHRTIRRNLKRVGLMRSNKSNATGRRSRRTKVVLPESAQLQNRLVQRMFLSHTDQGLQCGTVFQDASRSLLQLPG